MGQVKVTEKRGARFAGHVVELDGDTLESRELIGKVLVSAPISPSDADLILYVVRPGTVRHPRRAADRTAHHVSIWFDGDDQIVATGPHQLARVGAGRAMLDPGPSGFRGVHALLLPVLALLFADRGLCVVHAAAFLDRFGESAVLVMGGSGQGKSTLTTAALSTGRPALSDDLVVLRRNPDTSIDVSGVPQPFALPGDLARSGVVGSGIAGDHRQRRKPATTFLVDPDWHPVRAVVLVEHSVEPAGHLRRADARTTMLRLLASTLDGPSEGKVLSVFPYATAVANIPAWHLGLAVEAAGRLSAAEQSLADIDAEVSASSET